LAKESAKLAKKLAQLGQDMSDLMECKIETLNLV